jgi:hypothetical protein
MSDDIEDIVAMARAAYRDERLADGPLYGKLADEITRLRARVGVLERALHGIAEFCNEGDRRPFIAIANTVRAALKEAKP